MTQSQLAQIKDFDKDLAVVQHLKTDLDKYNHQLTGLVGELTAKTEECAVHKQRSLEEGIRAEQFKQQAAELEDKLSSELNYKKLYEELKAKVDE